MKPAKEIVVNANYQIFIFLLTVLLLINSILWLVIDDPDLIQVVLSVSLFVSAILLIDVGVRIFRHSLVAELRIPFSRWLLFFGSLPLPFFCLFRFIWTGLVLRKLRRKDYSDIGQFVIQKRAQTTLLVAIFAAILILEFAGILILKAETPAPDANIHNANDALWWTLVTVATVGYGDKFPVTTSGRIVGVLVMIVGVALFSVITSYLAQWFFKPGKYRAGQNDWGIEYQDSGTADMQRLERLENLLLDHNAARQEEAAWLKQKLLELEKQMAELKPTNDGG